MLADQSAAQEAFQTFDTVSAQVKRYKAELHSHMNDARMCIVHALCDVCLTHVYIVVKRSYQ